MVSVAPKSMTIWSMCSRHTKPRQGPSIMPVKKATDTAVSPSFVLPAPRQRAMWLPVPMPMVKDRAWIMAMAEKMIPTAPDALVPSWLTKNVSAIL